MKRISSWILTFLLAYCIGTIYCGYSSDSVRLSSIQVLTLYHGKITSGRRSSPVPQLKCVGGTAGCVAFIPQVVQCYNKGSDGNDIQWECKTEMDNIYHFGHISVSCEGYSHPEDPYVLKGSCGLEYTIDYSNYGNEKFKRHEYDKYQSGAKTNSINPQESRSSIMANIILLAIVGMLIYALYRTCLTSAEQTVHSSSTTNDDFRGYPGGNPYRASAPPPPGFRPDFTQNTQPSGASCEGRHTGFGRNESSGTGNRAGGFWTGAATGGLLGYMFGSRSTGRTPDYRSRENSYSENENWGGTTRRGQESSRSHGGISSSTGTRTASGFGGTTRR